MAQGSLCVCGYLCDGIGIINGFWSHDVTSRTHPTMSPRDQSCSLADIAYGHLDQNYMLISYTYVCADGRLMLMIRSKWPMIYSWVCALYVSQTYSVQYNNILHVYSGGSVWVQNSTIVFLTRYTIFFVVFVFVLIE